ncbi:MAG TPA: FG-GAP-like repeat-containing protein [Bryobacteraceae bacterium]|nr:FG-GAP-like repeat-containing protein [Bryobacteraceae bacterium]
MSRPSRILRWLAVILAAVGCWRVAELALAQSNGREEPLSIIVVASEAEANQVAAQLKAGADFGALAKKQSTDPTANDSGYMGVLDPANLRPELRDALHGVAPGQISGIAQIPTGYAILKVLKSPPAGSTPQAARALDLAGESAILPTPDFVGYSEANLAFSKYPKPAGWEDDLAAGCSARVNSVNDFTTQFEAYLKAPGSDPSTFGDVNSILSNLHSFRGEMDKAIAFREAALQIAQKETPAKVPLLVEGLGVAYLHRAGMTLYDRFAFPAPLDPARLTAGEKSDLAKAAGYFTDYLEHSPESLDVRWLLNLTEMLAGGYPASVPAKYRIDPALLRSKENVVQFRDVAAAAGLVRRGMAGGLIVDDFDNDGLLDAMISSQNDCVPLRFFHNNGDGTFTDRAVRAGLSGVTGGLNMIQTDYNNDGCRDVLVLRGGWEWARRKSLLRNNCDGTFTDVTREAGLLDPPRATQTAVWTDIDRDGRLDLFIGNENAPLQLFHNNGNGTFTDIAAAAGVDKTGFVKAVVAGDYDGDGYPDLYVSNFRGEHYLFHNNHDRTFTDVTQQAGLGQQGPTFGAWFFDYDNDGRLDLFVGGYYSSLSDIAAGYMGLPQKGEPLRLFHNVGNGRFQDVTADVGLDRVFLPMGMNFGDIDNDGYPDFYLGTGNPSFAQLFPNVLYHNDGGRHFTDVTASSGTGILPKGHGIAFADLDNDGDEDLTVVMGGPDPGDEHNARLFENPGNGNDWIGIHLDGVKSNRPGIGARIKVTVRNGAEKPRDVYATVGSGGSFGAGPFEQHIGLGKNATVLSVEIQWPSGSAPQVLTNTGKNRVLEIREDARTFTVLERHAFRLGK